MSSSPTGFSDLPLEIQHQIWMLTFPPPRVIQISWTKPAGILEDNPLVSPSPTLHLTSINSRNVSLERYGFSQSTRSGRELLPISLHINRPSRVFTLHHFVLLSPPNPFDGDKCDLSGLGKYPGDGVLPFYIRPSIDALAVGGQGYVHGMTTASQMAHLASSYYNFLLSSFRILTVECIKIPDFRDDVIVELRIALGIVGYFTRFPKIEKLLLQFWDNGVGSDSTLESNGILNSSETTDRLKLRAKRIREECQFFLSNVGKSSSAIKCVDALGRTY